MKPTSIRPKRARRHAKSKRQCLCCIKEGVDKDSNVIQHHKKVSKTLKVAFRFKLKKAQNERRGEAKTSIKQTKRRAECPLSQPPLVSVKNEVDEQPLNLSLRPSQDALDEGDPINTLPLKKRFKTASCEKHVANTTTEAEKPQQQPPAIPKIRVKNLKELMMPRNDLDIDQTDITPLTAPKPTPPAPALPTKSAKKASVIAPAKLPKPPPLQLLGKPTEQPQKSSAPPSPAPYLQILEQPSSNGLRFRYQCEGRSAGSMIGQSSVPGSKTYPKIKIHGYTGMAKVAVSCVEQDPPYRCHPHNLVGKSCTKGVCVVTVNPKDMTATISHIGIQCVKKKDMAASLEVRKSSGIDPFKQGFSFVNEGSFSPNPSILRLCFQAYLFPAGGKAVALPPVVSQPIRDKKAHCDLAITDISDVWSPMEGGKKILLFTKKINRADIEVHITFTNSKTMEHTTLKGVFNPSDVHEQCGISFVTPPFPDKSIQKKVQAQLFLYKPSDFNQSEPVKFTYYPAKDLPEKEPEVSDNDCEDSGIVIEDNASEEAEDYDNYDSERTLQIVEDEQENGSRATELSSSPMGQVMIRPIGLDNSSSFRLDIPYSILYPNKSQELTKSLDNLSITEEERTSQGS